MKYALRTACFLLLATTTAKTWAVVVASDDFDTPLNLISYSGIDAEGNDPTNTGTWSSPYDNFGPRSIADFPGPGPNGNWLYSTIVDETAIPGQTDTLGIIPLDYAGGNFFSILDTDNGANDSGIVTGTWVFDISSAASLTSFEVDMAAIGKFYDDGAAYEQFKWAYAIDGGLETELFTIRADASAGAITYTMDDGSTTVMAGDTAPGVDDNGMTVNGVPLLNELTTLSAPLSGSGDELTLTLWGFVNDNNAGLVVENIVINGAEGLSGDFDMNSRVDAADFLKWQRGESPSPFSTADLQAWTGGYGTSGTTGSLGSIPEPSTVVIVIAGLLGFVTSRSRKHQV